METTVGKLKELLAQYNSDTRVIVTGSIEIVKVQSLFEETKHPNSFILTQEVADIVKWDLNQASNREKVASFVSTLLSVWNPHSSITTLRNSKLNNTTLSRAICYTLAKGVPHSVVNIDAIINRLILSNIKYLQNKYDVEYGN